MCDEEDGNKEADPNEDWNCGSSTHTARFAPDVLEKGRTKLGLQQVESKYDPFLVRSWLFREFFVDWMCLSVRPL